MRSVLSAVLLLCACSSTDTVDRGKCESLRNHLIDLRLQGTNVVSPAELAQHRAAMRQALGESFLSSCEKDMSLEQINCAMRASDLHAATNDCSRVTASK
jgi:hypothetical protein